MKAQCKPAWETVERAIGNACRLKIIKALMKHPNKPLTKYMLEKYTHLNAREVKTHLKVLTELDWVEEIPYKPLKYRLNRKKEEVKRVTELFRSYV